MQSSVESNSKIIKMQVIFKYLLHEYSWYKVAIKIPEFELLNWLNTNTSRNKKESKKKPKRVKRKIIDKEELGKFEIIAKKMGQDMTFSEPISDLKKNLKKLGICFLKYPVELVKDKETVCIKLDKENEKTLKSFLEITCGA